MTTNNTFSGFDVPTQNWYKMPMAWTDITADIKSLAELKIVEYVLKNSWGYREYGKHKRITLDEFMHGRKRKDGSRLDRGTGLSKPSVVDGIKRAVEDGFLIVEVDDRDRGRVKKFYALKMAEDEGESNLIPGGKQLNLTPDLAVKNISSKGKETFLRTETESLDIINSKNKKKTETDDEDEATQKIWLSALEQCRLKMTQATFNTRLVGTQLLSLSDDTAVIGVPNALTLDWLRNRLNDTIARALRGVTDLAGLEIEFVLLESPSPDQ